MKYMVNIDHIRPDFNLLSLLEKLLELMSQKDQEPLLLTWFNFNNPSIDKVITSIIKFGMK